MGSVYSQRQKAEVCTYLFLSLTWVYPPDAWARRLVELPASRWKSEHQGTCYGKLSEILCHLLKTAKHISYFTDIPLVSHSILILISLILAEHTTVFIGWCHLKTIFYIECCYELYGINQTFNFKSDFHSVI